MEKWSRVRYLPGTGLGENGQRVTGSGAHIALSLRAAREGMVLLKNEGELLPLEKGVRVALFGKGIFDYVKGGGGSGDVTCAYARSLYEGLRMQKGIGGIFEPSAEYYRRSVEQQYAEGKIPGLISEPALPDSLVESAAWYTDTAIIAISRFSGENWDRRAAQDEKIELADGEADMLAMSDQVFDRGDFYLTAAEEEMVRKVTAAFPKVIAVLNVGGVVDTEWFRDDPRIGAVLLAWQGGMEGGLAAAQLLTGEHTPCGKLSDTFARRLEDYPSTEGFHASMDYVEYTEDIYVGYRYFETIPGAAEKVCYPFGYGLSYTRFSLSDHKVIPGRHEFTAQVMVTNMGEREGREVVQVYFSAPQGKLGKPVRALAGYAKTRLLQPGESQMIQIRFGRDVLASYDDTGRVYRSAWVLEEGEYRFFIGTSVRDTVQTFYKYVQPENEVLEALEPRMVPRALTRRLKADGTYEELTPGKAEPVPENALTPIDPAWRDMEPGVRAVPARHLADHSLPQFIEVAEGRMSMDDFVAALPDEALRSLLGGQPNRGLANTFGYGNLREYGVPSVMTADGPAGVRIRPECGVCTTAWPCATLLACTWDRDLLFAVGEAAGEEVRENNFAVWLAPAVNIHRSPLCGRNFEYYSEDPFLTAGQAGALVRGVQSRHVGTSVKHFALNNKETNRRNSDSRVSERAIREIYLKAFERIVKEADPWTIMSSYNIINGVRASENKDMLTHILREEWGYKGMVTSDWWNDAEQYLEVLAGNDVKMGCGYPERLKEAQEMGLLSREDLERSARRVLGMLLKLD